MSYKSRIKNYWEKDRYNGQMKEIQSMKRLANMVTDRGYSVETYDDSEYKAYNYTLKLSSNYGSSEPYFNRTSDIEEFIINPTSGIDVGGVYTSNI